MKVTLIGRFQWLVQSESRPEMVHLVDFEPTEYEQFKPGPNPGTWESHTVVEPSYCSCEAFNMLKHRPCKHQREVIMMLVDNTPLTALERENLTARLEQLCRESPHWVDIEADQSEVAREARSMNSEVNYPAPKSPTQKPSSIQTKRIYHLSK